MTIKIAHWIEEKEDFQVDIFMNVKQIHIIGDKWITLSYDEKDPLWKKFEANHGILFIGYDPENDDILIDE